MENIPMWQLQTRPKTSSNWTCWCAWAWHLNPSSQYEDFRANAPAQRVILAALDRVGALTPAPGQSKAWEQQGEAEAPAPCPDRLQPAGRTSSDRNTPQAGLIFGESMGVEQGRETLLVWEHQASSPGLTHSARRYGIRQVQRERWLLSMGCVTGGVKPLHQGPPSEAWHQDAPLSPKMGYFFWVLPFRSAKLKGLTQQWGDTK